MPDMGIEESISDDYVVELLKKDATNSSIRFSALGLYKPVPSRSNPKPNTRFLRNIIRETDSHNASLLLRETEQSRSRLKALKANSLVRERHHQHPVDRHDGYHEERHRKRRRIDDDDDERHLQRHRRRDHLEQDRSRKREVNGERDVDHSTKRRKENDDAEDDEVNVRPSIRKHGDERRKHGRHSEGTREREKGSHRQRRRRSSRSRSRSPRNNDRQDYARRRHSRSRSSSPSTDRQRRSRHHRSRRKKKDRESPPPSPDNPTNRHDKQKETAVTASSTDQASESDPLESIIGPTPPPAKPKIQSRGRGAFKSTTTMDNHFSSTYDPSIDVQPNPESEDDWDQALEALRDQQRWKKQGAERLRSAGFTNEEVEKWEKGGERREEDVRWVKRGEKREWDRGKVMDLEGEVDVRPEWGGDVKV
ncbi:MAG: hypothetical protein M1816_008269 [Peltula sp. TS41687]|nr:MAG: hypothetical protein M1816_008269 [Peltula sp. TS41687]